MSLMVEPRRGEPLSAAAVAEIIRETKRNQLLASTGAGQSIVRGPAGTQLVPSGEPEIGSARPKFSGDLAHDIIVGEPVSIQLAASPFAYLYGVADRAPLPSGLSLDADTGLITGAALEPGETTAVVWARNTRGARSAELILSAAMPELPVVEDQSAAGQVGEAFSYQIEVGEGGTPRTFAGVPAFAISGLPEGLSLDPETGLISGTPVASLDAVALTLTVSNASGPAYLSGESRLPLLTLTIRPPAAPRIISPADAGAFEGSAFEYYFQTNVEALLWEIDAGTPLPPGLSIEYSGTPWLPPPPGYDPVYARIVGTPTDPGVYQVIVRAGGQAGWGPPFTLTISIGTMTPQILAGSPPVHDLASGPLDLEIELNASNGPVQAWESRNAISPLAIEELDPPDASKRNLVGTINAAGTYTIEVRAANAFGWGEWLTIEIVAYDSRAPVITHDGTESGEALTTKEFAIVASNSPTSYGCTLVSGSAICSVSGSTAKVTARVAGEHTVRISATNAYGTAYADVVLTATDATYTLDYASSFLELDCGVDISDSEEITVSGIGPIDEYKASGMPSGLVLEGDGDIDGTHNYDPSKSYPRSFNVAISVKIAGEWFSVGTAKIKMLAASITITCPAGTSGTVSAADFYSGTWIYPADWKWDTGNPTLSHGSPTSSTWSAAKTAGTGLSAKSSGFPNSAGKLEINGGHTQIGYTTKTDTWRLSVTNPFGAGHVDLTITSRP